MNPRAHQLPCRWRTSVQKRGVAPSTNTRLVRRADALGEAGTREAGTRCALPQRTREIRVIPCPMRVSRQSPDRSGEGAPSESGALGLSKACTTCVHNSTL